MFNSVEKGKPIEVFQLNRMFLEDQNPKKANLGVGGEFFPPKYSLNAFVVLRRSH